jgi:hypothetical protein
VARSTVKGGLSVRVYGLTETLKALRHVEAELRPEANGRIRDAAGVCAGQLVPHLTAAAATSGVPVAPRVARSIRVRRDRMPTLSIGGSTRVGSGGAPAGALVWGSEQGPKGAVNHFAVAPGPGYWIKPAVERFKAGPALAVYLAAIAAVEREAGLF